jgi:hypothetical protein
VSVRRARPLADSARAVALELKRSEAAIALLDRVRPLNLLAEQARLTRACEAGRQLAPAFEYAPRVALGQLRGRLTEVAAALDASDVEQRLLAERALELENEAALSEHVADASFAALAARRFPLPEQPGLVQSHAQSFLNVAAHEISARAAEPLHVSDDTRDPDSLWSQISRLLSRENWSVRIECVAGLVSLAAVAEGVVRIRPGARLTAVAARRIALHELEGHLRPRAAGQRLGGAFLAGTARSSEDEEGRAILLEERAGLLDAERRRELGRRYLAAASVREGADFWQSVTLLGRAGASIGAAVELACRVHRGGGLGRELIYLSGYLRVATGLAARPGLERLLQHGRISLHAAEALSAGSIELDDDGDVI